MRRRRVGQRLFVADAIAPRREAVSVCGRSGEGSPFRHSGSGTFSDLVDHANTVKI